MRKKLLAICLALTLCFAGGAVGCTPQPSENTVVLDPDKEIINVSLFSAGFGTEWLTDLLNDYNKTLTGKYQFNRIAENTNSIDTITDQIQAGIVAADIYFNDTSDFQRLMRLDKLLDLTALWDAKPDGDDRTVRDKVMDADVFEKVYTYEDKIYGLPFSQGVSGIIYDHDFFKDANLLAKGPDGNLTVGIDGKPGTFDDGLPVTMDEFVTLCNTIKTRGYWPFLYTDTVGGGITQPVLEIITGMYNGYDSYKATVIYDGTYTSPSTGKTTEITPANGWLSYGIDEGRIKAVEFLRDVLLNENYFDTTLEGVNHTASEEQFLYSHGTGRTRVAMTLNGCWWEYEARNAFATDARRNGAKWGYGKRDFRFMPVPAIEGQDPSMNGKAVFSTNADGSIFAIRSGDEEKNRAILDFLRYFTSDEGLGYFATKTGSMPAYRFDLGDKIETLTPFSRNFYEIIMSDNTVILRPDLMEQLTPICYLTTNPPKRWHATIGGFGYEFAYDALKRTSFDQYVTALKSHYTESSWAEVYNQVKDVL